MNERLTCQCGCELPRPMPHKCPRCGALITAVHRNWLSYLAPFLLVATLVAVLFFYALWLRG